jgi:hypothetical protein
MQIACAATTTTKDQSAPTAPELGSPRVWLTVLVGAACTEVSSANSVLVAVANATEELVVAATVMDLVLGVDNGGRKEDTVAGLTPSLS